MFDVGFWELVLLGVIALIVLGPERLPEVARTAGRWVGRARRYASNLTSELERHTRDLDGESGLGSLRDELNRTRDELTRARSELNRAAERFESDSRHTIEEIESAGDLSKPDADATALPHDGEQENKTAAVDEDDTETGSDEGDRQVHEYLRHIPDELAEYADDEPFSVEKAREAHARRDRESRDRMDQVSE